MNSTEEVQGLEEKLRLAELGPDPKFFADHLDEDALIDGQKLKSKVVEAHSPGSSHKFDKVEMSDFEFVDHGSVVVVRCQGSYEGPHWTGSMKVLRVWMKKESGWKIVAACTL